MTTRSITGRRQRRDGDPHPNVDRLGCGPDRMMHVSSSFRYDLMTATDLGFMARTFIDRNHELRHDFRKFEDAAAEYREIVECHNVSGGCDYLLKVVAPSVARFQLLMERLLQDDIGIEKFNGRIEGYRLVPGRVDQTELQRRLAGE